MWWVANTKMHAMQVGVIVGVGVGVCDQERLISVNHVTR